MARKLFFENQTCSRCAGSGEYSYCQSYGTRCFKCHGDTVTLTKRGAVAQAWFNKRKLKPAKEVKVGDRVIYDGIPGMSRSAVVIVDFVGYREDGSKWKCNTTGEWKPYFTVAGVGAKDGKAYSFGCFENSDIKMHVWGEAKAALLAEAKAYQETLTKAGTVRKNKRKEVANVVEA